MEKEKYSYGYAKSLNKVFKLKEEEFNITLEKDCYYIIRFDGKNMTAGFKIKGKAINTKFFDTMRNTFYEFCKSTLNVIFAYSFSDEISILIKGDGKKSDNNRIEKLLSLLSARLALMFQSNSQKNKLDLKNKYWLFDARIIKLTSEEVVEYFLARQAFAIDKYIMQLKGEYKIDYKMNTSQIVLAQLKEKGIDYEKLPLDYRYGLLYAIVGFQKSFEFDTNKELLNDLIVGGAIKQGN